MKNIKKYDKFNINENSLLSNLFGNSDANSKNSTDSLSPSSVIPNKPKDVNTPELLLEIVQKIKNQDINPIYVFNQLNIEQSFYVSAELFNEFESLGLDLDPQDGLLVTNNGKYSYCVLNCTKASPDFDDIKRQLHQLIGKNQASGIKNIIEISNISYLSEETVKTIAEMISSRKIEDLSLVDGDFFILTDNSNSKRGGRDISSKMLQYFPKTPILIYRHNSSITQTDL